MKSKDAYVRARVSLSVKRKAERIVSQLGLDTSSYIRLCIHQLIQDRAIPFQAHLSKQREQVDDIAMPSNKRLEILDYIDE